MLDLSKQIILAVDDEQDNLEVFKATLEMLYDSQVHTALGAAQALEDLDKIHPTIIVTDLSMPGMDGYAFLNQLRRRFDLALLPVIAITAHAMAGDKERILEAGFNGYVSKPFEVMILGEQIKECLEQFESKFAAVPQPAAPVVVPQPAAPVVIPQQTAPVEVPKLNASILTEEIEYAIKRPSDSNR